MAKQIIDNSLTNPRSRHNLSENWTGSADFGRLIPFHFIELAPTEKVTTCKPRIEMQMLPLVAPTFGKMDLYVHYFWVPLRLTWKEANSFLSKRGEGATSVPPYWTPKDLYDIYQGNEDSRRALFNHWTSMGLPKFFEYAGYGNSGASASARKTLCKFRAYSRIWWDFYRDPEVLRDDSFSQYVADHDGHFDASNPADFISLFPRWRTIKDNWISNLFSESGLGDLAGVPLGEHVNPALVRDDNTAHPIQVNSSSDNVYLSGNTPSSGNMNIGQIDSVTIRKLEALTRLSERLSLSGKREIESLFALYGVKPSFEKLSMSQYIGGAKSTVLVSDITSSADTSIQSDGVSGSGQPLGAKAGAGYCAFNNLNINFTAQEHGYIVGVFSVMPHVHYVQGFNRSWERNRFEDWFQKSFERTGQVAVRKDEVRIKTNSSDGVDMSDDASTFAFTQPYYERKQGQDILAGDFLRYHDVYTEDDSGNVEHDLAYMHSLEMYADFPADRKFNFENLYINPLDFNKVFYYLGGDGFSDADDHFHLSVDKQVVLESPMDGYAVPTIETTEDPHASKSSVGHDTVL